MSGTLPAGKNIIETKSGLIPTTINEAMQLSEILAKSEIVPKTFIGKPSNIFVAISWGIEIGLSPMQSLQNIAVINGNPSLWGDASIALVRGSGLLQSIKETQTNDGAICVIQRVGEEPHTYTFTKQDATVAGLMNKDNYKKYPKRMFQMRARSFALRDVFPDVLKGLRLAEEEQDAIETEVASPEISKETKPTIDPMTNVNKQEETTEATEAEIVEDVTIKTINTTYKNATTEQKAGMATIFEKHPQWREYSLDNLASLNEELKAI